MCYHMFICSYKYEMLSQMCWVRKRIQIMYVCMYVHTYNMYIYIYNSLFLTEIFFFFFFSNKF